MLSDATPIFDAVVDDRPTMQLWRLEPIWPTVDDLRAAEARAALRETTRPSVSVLRDVLDGLRRLAVTPDRSGGVPAPPEHPAPVGAG
ncbi:hypothetical protein B1813_19090 [Saccharomonospora piscinae]|uniref:Uncharacterized protein n=1 Tax=Saccharomonospora piscinae TaxID=687388 RepID=A0A1V8ZYC7_SACPI|nr:hypothetical protein [Saccharomonospora piscinae]OQO89947.1 hypothetical protein B1813_19090 [Saccharomonospora piscinae]